MGKYAAANILGHSFHEQRRYAITNLPDSVFEFTGEKAFQISQHASFVFHSFIGLLFSRHPRASR
jgi:hypothetical protein